MKKDAINIFWTGGWDSTFRLLYLLIEEKKDVQPHFVVRNQKSVGFEIYTMIQIRRELFLKYPDTIDLLRPTIYIDLKSIPQNSEITKSVKSLNKQYPIAMQYDFCSRYCFHKNLNDMELCIEKDSNPQKFISKYFKVNWKNPNDMTDEEQQFYTVFKYFNFPLIDITKSEMKDISQIKGWIELLGLTWFCATPVRGLPCGICGPCSDVLVKGLSNRLPIFRRILSMIHMPIRKLYRNNIKYSNQ